MATTIINTQKVADFSQWKQGFEAGSEMRERAGITIKGVYQSADDANTVTVISEVPNSETAKAIFSGDALKTAMEKSGVVSAPEIKILNPVTI